MQTTSATYNTLIAASNHRFVVKINIDGTDYGEDEIFSAKQVVKCFDYEPTIGGTYCGTFEFSLLGDGDSIPRMAKVIPYYCVTDGNSTSEWIKMGEYYIDTRSITTNGGGINTFDAFCYDAMLKANAKYATSSLTWPATDISVVNEIATKMGVSVDSATATAISNGYSVQLPTEYSMREVLGYIGAMYGGNWIIDTAGKLRLIILGGTYGSLTVGNSVESATFSVQRTAYDKVILNIDENTYVEAGSTANSVMEATCPYATNAIASAVLSTLSTYAYLPFDASGVWGNPAVELGDTCSVAGSTVKIYSIGISYGVGMVMELSAPNDNDIDHEYEYESPSELEYKRTVNNINNSITLNSQGISLVSQKLDNFGGRNILLNSATKHIYPYSSATITFTDGVSVAEWGANDAISCVGAKGGNSVFATLGGISAASIVSINGQKYVHSIYIKNNDTVDLTISNNGIGNSVVVSPGETKRVIMYGTGNGYNNVQFSFITASTFDFVYWHPQIEYGEVATDWNPAPEDKVGNNEIISKINVSPEIIQIQASKISLSGKAIDLTSDNITITSTNFSVAADGTITATNGNFSGTITSSNASITGGTINITTAADSDDVIRLSHATSATKYVSSEITPSWLLNEYHKDSSIENTLMGVTVKTTDQEPTIKLYRSIDRSPFGTKGSGDFWYSTLINHRYIYMYKAAQSYDEADKILQLRMSGADGYLTFYEPTNGTTERCKLDMSGGLTFKDSNATTTAFYPSYGLYLQDFASKNMCDQSTFVQGSLSGQGAETSSTTRLRCPGIPVLPNTEYKFEINSSLSIYELHEYTGAGVFVKYTTINSTTATLTTSSTTGLVRILVRKTNNATIVPSEVTAMMMCPGIMGTQSYVPWVSDAITREAAYPLKSETIAPTYTTNSYCSQTSVNRVWIRKLGSIGVVHFNLSIDGTALTSSAGFVEIMQFTGLTPIQNAALNVPSQSGNSSILVTVGTDGKVTIYTAYGSASGFYRAEIPLLFA